MKHPRLILAASLGTLPISLWHFRQVSWLSLVVNPLVLWLLPAITLLGLGLCLFGWLPGLAALLAIPLWLLLHAALSIIGGFATLPVGILSLPSPGP